MMKFTLASRHRDDGTRERFFYEWSMIHVALMLTSPTVPKVFQRYVQHYGIAGITNDMLVHPLSEENWESFADHWVHRYEDMIESMSALDYVQRMQPHRFGSHRFITSLSNFEVVYERPGFRSGGVKLIHFLARQPKIPQEQFNEWFRAQHAPAMMKAVCNQSLVRKYVQDVPSEIDSAVFKGTLFELGSIGLYAGMEEIWFDSVEAMSRLRRDAGMYSAIRKSQEGFVDPERSISMVVNERVVWDFVTPGETTPKPAILNPASLEAAIDRQGYTEFDNPQRWAARVAGSGKS